MYKEIVRDPASYLAEVEARLAEEGEELEGEGMERSRALVKAAMKSRHLTPEEEITAQEIDERVDVEDEVAEKDTFWSTVRGLAMIIVALVMLILAFKN